MKKKQVFPKSVKFAHFRAVDSDGNINSHGGVTLAYATDNKDGVPVVYFGVAHCHINDNYNKAMGRIKAFGRLQQLAAHNGDLIDTTIMGYDKFFTMFDDSVKDALAQVSKAIEDDTGYVRVRQET